eukprot:CAMPEP_0194313378 /NCGR_PEP_ID=MMETSP0171-20130528/10250_1 /TAXON_ID=218684 /ORGANISM="Corethron pennatum, Strain L29A3" /LENGTH=119 /DNA_ID=CAMNT_0039068299 /DNA_START=128 /DNA_END=484 /DNA_ORIENTATION=-
MSSKTISASNANTANPNITATINVVDEVVVGTVAEVVGEAVVGGAVVVTEVVTISQFSPAVPGWNTDLLSHGMPWNIFPASNAATVLGIFIDTILVKLNDYERNDTGMESDVYNLLYYY